MGRPGLVLGMGPSHDMAIEGMYGLSYAARRAAHRGVHAHRRGRAARRRRCTSTATTSRCTSARRPPRRSPCRCCSARSRRACCGSPARSPTARSRGWRTARRSSRTSSRASPPRPTPAGRPAPRVVVGLPVAVHDDVDEAREAAARQYGFYGNLPNYERILRIGGLERSADACIVGDEDAVAGAAPRARRRRRHRRVGRDLPGGRRPRRVTRPHPSTARTARPRGLIHPPSCLAWLVRRSGTPATPNG